MENASNIIVYYCSSPYPKKSEFGIFRMSTETATIKALKLAAEININWEEEGEY